MDRGREQPGSSPEVRPTDRTFAPVRLTTTRGPLERWLALALIGLAVAIAKPWALGTPAPSQAGGPPVVVDRRSAGPSVTSPRPTEAETLARLVGEFCLDPGSWRIATVERWRDQTIRVWRAIETQPLASGPDDAAIPIFPIASEGVTELGWCAPVDGDEPPAARARVDAWRLADDRLLDDRLVALRLVPSHPDAAGSSLGALYLPLGTPEAEVWNDSTYVFRHRVPAGDERWFGVRLETRPSTGTIG